MTPLHLLGIEADGEALVLNLVERIERCRALRPEESDLVAELIRREKRRAPNRSHAWTAEEDKALLRAGAKPRGVIRLAKRIGVSEKAARRRLEKLRIQGKGAKPARVVEEA